MSGHRYDIAIAGGGVSGGLIALALRRVRPDVSVVLVERGAGLGGSRLRTWFEGELPKATAGLLNGFRLSTWDDGADMRFARCQRHVAMPLLGLTPEDFEAALRRELPPETIRVRAEVANLDAGALRLASGEEIAARTVIDCRGADPVQSRPGGWLVAMTRHLVTDSPHGFERPLLIDARPGGRDDPYFVRVLPLGLAELHVEVACHAARPEPDRRALASRIEAWCTARHWQGRIIGNTVSALPLVSGRVRAAMRIGTPVDGAAAAGTRGGLFHPLTGESLPLAIEVAGKVAANADLPGDQLAALIEERARRHWRATRQCRRMGAGRRGRLDLMLSRLCLQGEAAFLRFHAGRSTRLDRLRVWLAD